MPESYIKKREGFFWHYDGTNDVEIIDFLEGAGVYLNAEAPLTYVGSTGTTLNFTDLYGDVNIEEDSYLTSALTDGTGNSLIGPIPGVYFRDNFQLGEYGVAE